MAKEEKKEHSKIEKKVREEYERNVNGEIVREHLGSESAKVVKEEKEFENILPEDHFISKFIKSGTNITDAYPEYHFTCGLNSLSIALGRGSIVRLTPSKVHMNWWSMNLGESSVSRKTTSVDHQKTVLQLSDLTKKILPDDFTPESLISELAENPQSAFIRDEIGSFLAGLKKQYQLGLTGFLCRMYDCPDHYRRKLRKEIFELENVYLTLIGSTTPKQLARYSTSDYLETGFFPRINFMWPERLKKRKRRRPMTEEDDKRKIELGKWLSEIYKFSTGMVRFGGIEFTLDSEVLDAYNNWCEKVEEYIIESEEGKEFAAYFGRLQNDVIKMACFFEIGKARYREKINKVNKIHKLTKLTKVADVDSLSQLTKNFAYFVNLRKIPISQESLEVAIYYATNFFIPYWIKVSRYIIANEDADKIEKVFNIAIRFSREGKIKHSDLLRHSHMSARFFEECVKTLVDSGRFEEERVDTGGSKSQKWYRPIEVDKEKKSLPKPKIPTFSIEKEEAKELDDLINKIKKSKKDDYDTP